MANTIKITYPAILNPEQQKTLRNYKPFAEWLERLGKLGVTEAVVRDVAFFGARPGFIFAEGKARDAQGRPVPSLTFIRGDSVGILMVVKEEGAPKSAFAAAKTILVRQARFPVGAADFAEIPAGMLDGSGDFTGTAAKEIEEETGIKIRKDMLKPLGVYHVSPGGTDERMALFAAEITMPKKDIEALQGKLTGLATEGESIHLQVCDLKDVAERSGDARGRDMKSVLAAQLYKASLRP